MTTVEAGQVPGMTGTGVRGVIVTEAYLNLNFDTEAGKAKVGRLGYLFGDFSERLDAAGSIDQVVDTMNRLGIRRAQFNVSSWDDMPAARRILEQHPDRFACSVRVDPHDGVPLLRRISAAHADLPGLLTSISVVPFIYTYAVPPDDKHYYPLYAKCAELELPVNVNVGIPGPKRPGGMQHPMYLDTVAYDFPELTIVMRHGGDPWADVCAKLLLKWPNLYYCTDAWAPKHYRPEILHFANTRGADKVMYGGYFPALPYERIFAELEQLPLRDHVWEPFLSGNARRVYKI